LSLGDIAAEQKRWDEAIEHYEAVLRIWPDQAQLRPRLDYLRKQRGKRDGNREKSPSPK
jgi:hypothetical protein